MGKQKYFILMAQFMKDLLSKGKKMEEASSLT
jgi:hypothetical protein